MATYVIGDIQACYRELQQLLQRLEFDADQDRLWFTGDLVGRGPAPLETLRYIRNLADKATVVLGNHDLHLLAQAAGVTDRRDSSLQAVMDADDRDELLHWLRHRSLLHLDNKLGFGLIHAGLAPQWDVTTAARCAAQVEAALQSPDYAEFLRAMYGNRPDLWSEDLEGQDRLRFITNCLTRLRYCTADGRLTLKEKGRPDDTRGLLPWFAVPGRRSTELNWLFGHWSTLGQLHWPEHNVHGLDSGCLWGGALTALCLESGELTQLPCKGYRKPGK